MKWFLIFALAFAICQCGIALRVKGDDDDSAEKDEPFTCWDDTELPEEQVCDGEEDCEDGEDERIWACAEKNNQFMCHDWPDPTLLDNSKLCDGVSDCPISPWSRNNVSDDESKHECHDPETEFPCDDSNVIPIGLRCDGHNDCPAEPWSMWANRTRDEDLWECKTEDQFICWEDEAYIDASKVCDGKADCSKSKWSNSNTTDDELLYHCPEEMTEDMHICWGGEKMVDEDLMCDGNDDCPNEYGVASDENAYDCATEDEFACSASQLIKKSKLCDNNPDCLTEDEMPRRCEYFKEANLTEFRCWGGDELLPVEKMCDGTPDCVSRDEEDCEESEESEDSANIIFRRNTYKEREFSEFLQRKGINRRSLGMH